MVLCPRCNKENEDSYRFCLGCGADLTDPPLRGAQRPADQRKAPSFADGAHAPAAFPGGSASPSHQGHPHARESAPLSPEAAGNAAPCPACGTQNPVQFMFCGSCGARLKSAARDTASQQAVRQHSSGLANTAHQQPNESWPSARLALIKPDGSEGGSFPLADHEVAIGRNRGDIFANDRYLSPQHARISFEHNRIVIEDMGSLNGVFVRIDGEEPLYDGDIFRIGQELLRFDVIGEPLPADDGTEIMGSPNPGYWGRLSLIVGTNLDGIAFPLMGDDMVLGRDRGDILFSDDGYVSGTHAKVTINRDGNVFLVDLGSSNGTFIRIREPRAVNFGAFVLMGQQLFRLQPE